MASLCNMRLEAARDEIVKDMGSVSEIAVKYGFSNLGRFARQYAERYGQKPSETRLHGPMG